MKALLYIIGIVITAFVVDDITARSLENPFPCIGIAGPPGSGKTLLLTYFTNKYLKQKRWKVYANFDVYFKGVEVKKFNLQAFKAGKWFPEDGTDEAPAIMLIDELGIDYDNRNFKGAFKESTLTWLREHRHHKCAIIWASQTYDDVDKKWRNVTEQVILVKRAMLRNFISYKRIFKKIDLDNQVTDKKGKPKGGNICEYFIYETFPHWLFMRKWIRHFNSYDTKTHKVEKEAS